MASFEWPPSGSGSGGSGTVTSVGLLDSTGFFNVTESPVTTSGNLTLASFQSQAQNAAFIGPVSGGAGAPTFRILQSADIPTLPYISTTLGATATSGGFTVSGNTLSASQSSATVNGWLSSTDWSTFNGKQAAGNYISALTGDITATGPGSAAATLATVNASPGTTAISTVTTNAKGLVTSNTAAATTGSGSVVLATSPTLSNPVVGTQSQFNGSTLAASTSYVDTAVANAVAGVNPAVAVQAATTTAANTSGFTYNNGVSGVGATFTGTTNTAVVIDGFTFTALGQRLLVKNDTQSPSGAFNGIYYVTQVQTSLLPPILTRALDYDTPSDINNTGAIPVVNGTVNGTTSWVETAQIVTVGTTPLVFVQFSVNPSTILTNPMTTSGDVIYGGTSGAPTRLAGNTAAALQFLAQTGTGSASAPPVWTTAVPTANGGTGNTSGGMIATNFVSYTPTFVGLGTVTGIACFWARRGDCVLLKIGFTTGTVTASTATVSLPSGQTYDTSKLSTATSNLVGYSVSGSSSSAQIVLLAGSSNGTTLNFGNQSGSTNGLASAAGNALFGSSQALSFFSIEIPIVGWTWNV